ncbi:MAG TPA: hypothetical protein VKZ18_24600 [Polyangia bacterium]|nr:hypothetical protein [Polyangia bacterium]
MNASPAATALRSLSSRKLLNRLRAAFGRAPVLAKVTAPPEIALGERLEVSWRLDYGALEVTNVSVALVGSEVARERISARTGISVVTDTRPFVTLAIDRRMPAPGVASVDGLGAAVVPADSVPTLSGRLNEIAWAVVIEAAYQADAVWRDEFPVVVLPRRS